MKSFLFTLFSFLFFTSYANTYYFSSTIGDDSRTAQQSQSMSTPWKTLDKFSSFSSNFLPGDIILFKRGETFYGSLEINSTGTVSQPITIGAFGTGSKPVITGLQDVTNWVPIGGNIYEYNCTNCPSNLNLVIFQDTLQPLGRWPKLSAPGAGYLVLDSHVGSSSITSSVIASAPNFVSGEIVIRPYGWILNRARVTNQTSTAVNYTPFPSPRDPGHTYEPQNGYGFFFQNHINALTELGDWMFDSNNKKLRMFFGSQNPANYSVKAAFVENLVHIASKSFINFNELSFKGANSNAIKIDTSTDVSLTNCDINFSGIDAITVSMGQFSSLMKSRNITVRNCTISNSNNNAITANGSSSWNIDKSTIKNSGMVRGMGVSGDGQYSAISHVGGKSLLEYNEIRNTGYIGIDFEGETTVIKNNYIDSFCVIKSDGGGIYSSAETAKTGRRIKNNIILNGIGDRFGRSKEEIANPFAGNVHGIYLDAGATDVIIDSNTVSNCSNSGLELSSPLNVTVLDNTFYNNTTTQVYYFESKGPITNLNFKRNIAFAKRSDQLISLISSSVDNEKNWGVLDSNYYARPVSEPNNVDTPGYSHTPTFFDYPDGGIIQLANFRFYSLDKWVSITGQDAHTKKTPPYPTDLNLIRFEYNPTNAPKTITLSGTYFDVKNNFYSNTVTLAPYSSIILLKKTGENLLNQTITFNTIPSKTFGDQPFALNATASSGLPVTYRVLSGPATISGNFVTLTGAGTVIIEAAQAGDVTYNPAPPINQTFNIAAPVTSSACSATGSLTREQWDNVFGIEVSDIPLNTAATSTNPISMFETLNTGSNMGARIRGYICPPISGNYTFYISGDDAVELWLSTDDNPLNKVKIAGYSGWTGYRDFSKYSTQKSGIINLQVGRSYFVEVLHKNGGGGDNVTVKWQLPDGSIELPIPGSRLSPYPSSNSVKINQTVTFAPLPSKTFGDQPFVLNATASSGLPVTFRIVSGPATVSGNVVTLTGAGTVVIEASQLGNATYNPASNVNQSFNVNTLSNGPTFLNNSQIVLNATCGNNDGSIYIIVTGGIAPFMYSINGGLTYVSGPNFGYTFINLSPGTYKLRLKDANGIESSIVEKVVYNDCPQITTVSSGSHITALAEAPFQTAREVVLTYPNPSKGQFRVQLQNFNSSKAEVSIIDSKGTLIEKRWINGGEGNSMNFNLSRRAKGMYYLKIVSSKGTLSSKIIIQ